MLENGYGLNYGIGREKLRFSISSRRQCPETCSRSFRKVLEGALEDLMALACEQGEGGKKENVK